MNESHKTILEIALMFIFAILCWGAAMIYIFRGFNPRPKKCKIEENRLIKIGLMAKKYDQPDVKTLKRFLNLEIECMQQEEISYPKIFESHKQDLTEMLMDYDWLVLNTDIEDNETVIF
jgi:hypothetical protein